LNPADRLTGEQALRHAYFDDIREPEVEEELSSLIAPVQRPIYSSQSRITSYGQKFGNNYLQSQLIQPGIALTNQRQNGSVSPNIKLNLIRLVRKGHLCPQNIMVLNRHLLVGSFKQLTENLILGNNGSAISGNNG